VRFARAGARPQLRPARIRPGSALLLAAATAASLAAGCQGPGRGGGGPQVPITVAAIRGVDNAPLYFGVRNGTFARAGLDVTIRQFGSVPQELTALSNGSADIAAGDYVDFFYQVSKSSHPFLRIIADGYHAAPGMIEVLTYPGSGITSPQGLVHRTVGTPPSQGIPVGSGRPYSTETLAAQSVLTNDGVDPTQVKWRPMPTAALIGALAAHRVAAILVPEPYIFEAETSIGAIPVLDAASGATASLPLSGYFATASFIRQHAQAVADFQAALEQAQADAALATPVRSELATQPGMTRQAAELITLGDYPTSLNVGSIARVASLMFNFEMLTPAINVSSLVVR